MFLFRSKIFTSVTIGHLVIDIFNSMAGVVVTFLSVPLALTTGQIGLALSAYSLVAAITQPAFGWLADRMGSRWLGPGSVAWTIMFLALAIFTAQTTHHFVFFLLLFSLAAVGSGAFHPLATMHSTDVPENQAAMAAGIFFFFGQIGLAAGPIMAGFILDNIGPIGIYSLALATIPFLIFMTYAMRQVDRHLAPSPQRPTNKILLPPPVAIRWGAIILLALITALRSWVALGTVSFLPKMFHDLGWDATAYGLITGTYWLASGFTGIIGGSLADRWGRRQVVFITLLIGSLPVYFLPLRGDWTAFVLVIISGCFLGASHSTLVVIAQALLPGQKAFASGVTLGYLFGAGAVASWLIGLLAESWGLTQAIQLGAGIGVAGAVLALLLPKTRLSTQPAIVSATSQT
jgi:FSR family fosmidomycin resistance protein-like MFS transporter